MGRVLVLKDLENTNHEFIETTRMKGLTMLVCDICWEIYSGKQSNLETDQLCPKRLCSGRLRDIDELLLPTIRMLNQKGYTTSYCCSGHFSEGKEAAGYITFAIDNTTKMCRSLPKGFKVDPDPPIGVHLRWEFQEADECALHRAILKRSSELLSWAERLRPRW
jgi:hypothetical protein